MSYVLTGKRVLDLTGEYGTYCTKQLAGLGAEVIKIEPPKGCAERYRGPFMEGGKEGENSLYFAYMNTGKKSIVLDLDTEDGQKSLLALAAQADVLVESFTPGYLADRGLAWEDLKKVNPSLIMASVTPFGQTGPRAKWHGGSDLISFASAGGLYENGEPSRDPLQVGSDITATGTSFYTLVAIMSALYAGVSTHIDISAEACMAAWRCGAIGAAQIPPYDLNKRIGSVGPLVPSNMYRCKDGFAYMVSGARFDAVVQWMKDVGGIDYKDYDDPKYFPPHSPHVRANLADIDRCIGEIASRYTKSEFMEEAQKRRLPCGTVETPDSAAKNTHYLERNTFREVDHPVLGKHKYVGSPIGLTKSPLKAPEAAPLLGQHQAELETLCAQREKKAAVPMKKPLEGVTILDFGWVIAGPHGTRLLCDLGATIIRVESSKRLDSTRPDTPRYGNKNFAEEPGWVFNENNRNKLGISLNMKTEEGKKLFVELVKKCDILTSNLSPRGLRSMGLDYDTVKEINPNIITLNASGLGDWGPYADYVTFAPVLHSVTGLLGLIGYENEDPFGYPGLLADYLGSTAVATALLAALIYRQNTGEGQFIDLAQSEVALSSLGVQFLDWDVNQIKRPLSGNHHYAQAKAPHNVYPCAGEDKWCAIVAADENEWQGLVKAVDQDWIRDEKYATLAGRIANQDELDQQLRSWTSTWEHREIANYLQGYGVSAVAVLDGAESVADEHLNAQGYFVNMDMPIREGYAPDSFKVCGLLTPMEGLTFESPRPAPGVGRDNEYVLKTYLGMTDEEIQAVAEAGALV